MASKARPELKEAERRLKIYRETPNSDTLFNAQQAYLLLSKTIGPTEIDLALEVAEITEDLENEIRQQTGSGKG